VTPSPYLSHIKVEERPAMRNPIPLQTTTGHVCFSRIIIV